MKRQTFSDINITPLTDIFLVLLIIMMVVAPMLDQQGLNLTVPDFVEASQIKQDPQILNVYVSSDDKYFIDGIEISFNDLASKIKDSKDTYKDGLMIEVKGDSTHKAVVRLMDIARSSGILNISISEV